MLGRHWYQTIRHNIVPIFDDVIRRLTPIPSQSGQAVECLSELIGPLSIEPTSYDRNELFFKRLFDPN
jgi:hypothetical protein